MNIIEDACSNVGFNGPRYHVMKGGEVVVSCNKVELDLARAFHTRIADEFSQDVRDQIDMLNADYYEPGVCATHDVCDANVPMGEAFEQVVGHEVDPGSEEDAALWSKAWDVARHVGFGKEFK